MGLREHFNKNRQSEECVPFFQTPSLSLTKYGIPNLVFALHILALKVMKWIFKLHYKNLASLRG